MPEATILGDEGSSEGMTPEQIQELIQQGGLDEPQQEKRSPLVEALAGDLRPVAIPAIIKVEDRPAFHAADSFSWGWTPFGVFAIGRYEDDDKDVERPVLFRGDIVESLELDPSIFSKMADAAEAEFKEAQATGDVAADEVPEEKSKS